MTRPALRLEPLESRAVPAVVGALDPSFGVAGVATASFGGTDTGSAVAVQPDGKIVVVGTTSVNSDFAVARFNPNGSLDTSFGGTGTVRFSSGGPGIPGGMDAATAVAVQPDGKIVVVGTTDVGGSLDFAVIRVLADGSALDTTFSGDGKLGISFNLGGANEDRATGVALQADGRIVVVGTAQVGAADFDFGVVRLGADGTPDAAFDGDGVRTVAFNLGGANVDRATGVAVAGDGSIVIGGSAEVAVGSHDFAAARLTATGALDAAFSGDGKATVDLGGDDAAAAVAVRPDGKVVLAGTAAFAFGPRERIVQLTAAGAPDAGFGLTGNGVTQVLYGLAPPPGQGYRLAGLALDGRGRVVVAGSAVNAGVPTQAFVGRLTAAGVLDTSFSNQGTPPPADSPGGSTFISFGGNGSAAGVAIDANGRIVVAGSTSLDSNIVAARLIGSVEKGDRVAAGGTANGTAALLVPDAAGALPNTATAAIAAFGTSAADVRAAVGDYNGDGTDDTILVSGPGVPLRVAVVSGKDNATLLAAPFNPYTENFSGGGFVAAGDFDRDGRAEIVLTPDQGGGPRVVLYGLSDSGQSVVKASFLGIDDANFRGGARAAVGDVNGDGVPDLIVAAGFGGGPRVAVFGGTTVLGQPSRLVADFFAFPGPDAQNLRNGAFVAAGDVTGDGFADLIFGGGPGGAPRVFILSGQVVASGNVPGAQDAPVSNFFVANNSTDRGGVRVAAADLDGDQKADLVAGSGEGRPAGLRAYLGKNVSGANEPAAFQDVTVFGGGTLPGGVYVG